MAFLDDFGKKAQDMAELPRLYSLINEEEKNINALYVEIGKLFITHFSQQAEGTIFQKKLDAIAQSKERISNYNNRIQEIKGIVSCPKCGAAVPRSSAFCSSCGNPMPKLEPAIPLGHVRCPGCGAAVPQGMNFCTSCGSRLAPAVQETPVEKIPEINLPDSGSQTKLCSACGYANEDFVIYCVKCGNKL